MLNVSAEVNEVIRSFKVVEHKHGLFNNKELQETIIWKSELFPEFTIKLFQPRPCYGLTLELYKGEECIFTKPEYKICDIAECGSVILENCKKVDGAKK